MKIELHLKATNAPIVYENAQAGYRKLDMYCVDIMLDGVIPGTKLALERTGLTVDDIDLFEINEAFAPVPIAWMNELNIPIEKVNVNGGAIAMGHPLGGTGGILMATLLNEMDRQNMKYGMVVMCAAYGQSGTIIFERLPR